MTSKDPKKKRKNIVRVEKVDKERGVITFKRAQAFEFEFVEVPQSAYAVVSMANPAEPSHEQE